MNVIAKSRPETKPYWARCIAVVAVTTSAALLSSCMSGLDLFEDSKVDSTIRTSTVANGERLSDETTVRNAVSSADLVQSAGQPIPWANSASGSAGVISTIAENRDGAGRTCRDFVTTKHSYQGIANYSGRTCLGNSGEWLLLAFDLQG
ncbi:RT0821/Lpp0805 family surface protein [Shinella sp. CPCC 101442]|uniref:RT0821/Lpp0805 family surface protein n=1 Tax=Shinella sp. CPCC 101442 TaxID=2932265 RepID=UPI0021524832|nr:RT0821/Lpp0805 family surface protein [Shinella sp. CPCC 101442]MCR6499152.1 RT0821/Lpp0805 family surface protein [Shinella sp. CPCC 101442]